MPTRDELLSQPRSGARPLGGSAPASTRAASPRRSAPVPDAGPAAGSGAASGRVAASPGPTPPSGPRSSGERRLPEPKAYGNILLMEFIGVLLLTVLTPWSKQNHRKGLSPYGGAEMVKLAAIILLFFILSAVASASAGAARLAAWMGGLVLIADGLYEAANIAKDFQLFTGGLATAAGASTGSVPPGPGGTLPIATMPVGGSGDPAGGQPPPASLFPVVQPGGGGGQFPVP